MAYRIGANFWRMSLTRQSKHQVLDVRTRRLEVSRCRTNGAEMRTANGSEGNTKNHEVENEKNQKLERVNPVMNRSQVHHGLTGHRIIRSNGSDDTVKEISSKFQLIMEKLESLQDCMKINNVGLEGKVEEIRRLQEQLKVKIEKIEGDERRGPSDCEKHFKSNSVCTKGESSSVLNESDHLWKFGEDRLGRDGTGGKIRQEGRKSSVFPRVTNEDKTTQRQGTILKQRNIGETKEERMDSLDAENKHDFAKQLDIYSDTLATHSEIIKNEVLLNEECDWENMSTLLNKYGSGSRNWTTTAMQTLCIENEQLRAAKGMSLMRYIRETGTPSFVDISFLMKLLGLDGFNSGHEKTICDLFDEVKKLTDSFEPMTGDAIILGLSKTKRWRECMGIIDDIELFRGEGRFKALVAEAAFYYGDTETGFGLLEKLETGRKITGATDNVYLRILETQDSEQILNLLNFMKEFEVIPTGNVAVAIADFFCRSV